MGYFGIKEKPEVFTFIGDLNIMVIRAMNDLVKTDSHNLDGLLVIVVHANTQVFSSQLLVVESELGRKHLVPLHLTIHTFNSYFYGSSIGSGYRYFCTVAVLLGRAIEGASSKMNERPIFDYIRENERI